MKKKYLYMLVSRDKYELPLVVADNLVTLARKLDMKPNSIKCMIYKAKRQGYKCQYVKVEYDETEED